MSFDHRILLLFLFLRFASMAVIVDEEKSQVTPSDYRPVVLICAEQIINEKVIQRYPYAKGKSYIAASYVKFVESAGARVMPISDKTNVDTVEQIFNQTNGVLFPGGSASLSSSGYERLISRFFDCIKQGSKNRDLYPLMGICLGVQQEAVVVAQKRIVEKTDSINIGLPMTFTKAIEQSRFFKDMPDTMRETLSQTGAAFNNHHFSVLLRTFLNDAKLSEFYNILSTSKDRIGNEFVAAMEAKEYPIFGLQWHPEKTMYEWKPELKIDRSEEAVAASQFIVNRFIHYAKQNKHKFPASLEDKLIYRYTPVYTGDISSFQQIYIL